MNIHAAFDAHLLKLVHADVKRHFPALNLRTAAWVYHFGNGLWEFHGPEDYYWHGDAGSAREARAKGWEAYMEHKGIEGYREDTL